MTKQLTFGSLFAGIGGFDLGLERAGMQCAWQVEIDDFCRKMLAKHWPDVPKYMDIREVQRDTLEPVDVLVGGFPCQDISNAASTNGRAGLKGRKSGLWTEFYRLIRELKPNYVFIENVSALRSRGLNVILSNLAQARYDAEWTTLRASDFGAPHHRARLWVVGYTNSSRQPNGSLHAEAQILSEPDGIEWSWPDPPEHVQVADGVPYRLGIRAYGNAVVPQIAEWIGRRIIMHANSSPAC